MKSSVLFGTSILIGALANILFAFASFFFADVLFKFLKTPLPTDQVWVKDAALLLTFLSLSYLTAASEPLKHQFMVVVAISARFVFALFWISLVQYCNYDRGYLLLGITDLAFGVVQALLFWKVILDNRKAKQKEDPNDAP